MSPALQEDSLPLSLQGPVLNSLASLVEQNLICQGSSHLPSPISEVTRKEEGPSTGVTVGGLPCRHQLMEGAGGDEIRGGGLRGWRKRRYWSYCDGVRWRG